MWYNRLITSLLLSPLHPLLDRWMLVLTCLGRKSGRSYRFPVQYVRSGSSLLVVSSPDRTWWRNLQGGAPVSVHLGSQEVTGCAVVLDNPAVGLRRMVENAPHLARILHIHLNEDGTPDANDLAAAAKDRVVVQIQVP